MIDRVSPGTPPSIAPVMQELLGLRELVRSLSSDSFEMCAATSDRLWEIGSKLDKALELTECAAAVARIHASLGGGTQ